MKMLKYFMHLILVLLLVNDVSSKDESEDIDDLLEQIVEDFKNFCPYTDLCFSTARKNFTSNGIGTYTCCLPCDCDVNCGTACCPDKPKSVLKESEVRKFKSKSEQCVYAQTRRFSSYKRNGKAFNMIGSCPTHYTDEDVKVKCAREYHELNFEKNDINNLKPVSSEIMNVTFKNYYCASCHNAIETKLHFWDTKAVCKDQNKLIGVLSDLSAIHLKLSEESSCQVIFEPSPTTPWYTVKPCTGIIDRCNVTGDWDHYNPDLETACLSYASEYKGFKNIHCYFCNGHTFRDKDGVCHQVDVGQNDNSFVALLDFNDLEGPSIPKAKCSRGSKYDTFKTMNEDVGNFFPMNLPSDNTREDTYKFDPCSHAVCRPLLCAAGMMLSQNKCIPLYPETVFLDNIAVVSLRFNLLPSHITARDDSDDLMILAFSVSYQLIPKIYMLQTAQEADICAFNAYLKLEDSLENTIMLMNRDNLTDFIQFVSYLGIAVDINVEKIRNISATLEEMATIFATNDYYAQYSVLYPSDDSEIPQVYSYNVSEEYVNSVNKLNLDHSKHYMLLGGRNDPNDGLGILWFLEDILLPSKRCKSALSIQPNPFCPRVTVSRNEFNIDIAKRRMASHETDHFPLELSFSKMLSTKSDESVLVCVDEYFAQLPTESSTVNNELVVLTVICLVFSIMSLLLTFVVYCFLPMLRTLPGLNNMALIFHLFLSHSLTLVIAVTNIKLPWLCSAVGIVLHYSLLAGFFWMFICTFHMMNVFVKLKEKSAPDHTVNKFVHYLMFTASLPIILIISHIVVSLAAADDAVGFGYGGLSCYIRGSSMILYFVAVPLGLVVLANLAMFSKVIWSVIRLPDMAKHSTHERQNILIFAKLSTITGITWIFGFLYQFTGIMFFAYAYIIFNAGQGVFIMISFVINERVLVMLCSFMHRKGNGHSDRTSRSLHISGVSSVNSNNHVTGVDPSNTKF